MSPERREAAAVPAKIGTSAADRLGWAAWGSAGALFVAFALSGRGFKNVPVVPGTEIATLTAVPFALPAGALLGFALATWRNRTPAATDVDRPASHADASTPAGTD